MPATFIPLPDVARCALEIVLAGQHIINVYHFLKTGSWDEASLTDLITAMKAWVGDNIKGTVSLDQAWVGARATDLTSLSAPSVEVPWSPTVVGTKTGHAVTTGTAGVVSLISPLRGRSYRGRSYLSGIALSDATDEATFTTALATAIALSYSVINLYTAPVVSAVHVIPSRFNAGAPRVTGVATGITGWRMDTAFDSQRRRLQGRGT